MRQTGNSGPLHCQILKGAVKAIIIMKKQVKKTVKLKENSAMLIFLICACIFIIALLLIIVFIFSGGAPAISQIGLGNFLFGKEWRPENDIYGLLPMITGSILVTLGAIIAGVPLGLLTSVFMSRFCPKKLYRVLHPFLELLAGIPSVVYGFFGLVVMVPFIRDTFGGSGFSLLTASLLLGIMILPTVIGVSEAAISAVPQEVYYGALALGSSHEKSVFTAVLPAAKSGVAAAVVLGIGRAVGETMAVIMVAGNQTRMPTGLLNGISTLTGNIVMEMGYAADLHRQALIATAAVLFAFILLINLVFALIKRRSRT